MHKNHRKRKWKIKRIAGRDKDESNDQSAGF
jgi:hypothetical protein